MKKEALEFCKNPSHLVKTHLSICYAYIQSGKRIESIEPYWNRLIKVGELTRGYYNKKNQNG